MPKIEIELSDQAWNYYKTLAAKQRRTIVDEIELKLESNIALWDPLNAADVSCVVNYEGLSEIAE